MTRDEERVLRQLAHAAHGTMGWHPASDATRAALIALEKRGLAAFTVEAVLTPEGLAKAKEIGMIAVVAGPPMPHYGANLSTMTNTITSGRSAK